MSRGRALLAAGAVAMAAAAPAPLLAAGYESPAPVTAVLTGTAAAAAAVTAAAHRLLRGPVAVPAGLPAAAVVLLALAAWSPGPVEAPVPAVVDAVLHSGPRILTTAPHPPATVDLLAFPVLAVWLAAALATALRLDGRALPALLPCALLLCGAAALNPEAIESGYLSVALLGGAAAVALAAAPRTAPDTSRAGFTLRTGSPAARPRRRPLPRVAAAGTAVACAIALPGAGAAVAMPGVLGGWPVRADDPRGQGDTPDLPREARNPLSYLSGWAAEPDVPLMTVTGPRTDLRWVALSEFTGPVWLPDSTYRPAGSVLPDGAPVPPGAVSITERVSVRDLPGDWVPVPGVPTRVDGISVGHDADAGTVLSADGPVTGRSYTATGTVPDWRGWRGTDATAASGQGFERYLRLPPGAPPKLAAIARSAAGDGNAHQRASRIAEYLRKSYTFAPGTPGGHGYADLAKLLVQPGRRGGGATSEQFASAFAVLARAAGLPSRVVVGFGPGTGGDTRVIRSGDAVAWGEVYFDDLGWVPYDPNPQKRSAVPPPSSQSQGDDGTHYDKDAPGTAASGPRGSARSSEGGGTAAILTVLPVALAVLLLLYLVGVPLLRLPGRRRSRRGPPTDRILAAWVELLAALRLAGSAAPPSATAAEVSARLASEVPGADPGRLYRLGALVNAAGFGGPVTMDDAAFATEQVRGLTAGLRRSSPLSRRLSWWWDPRPPLWSLRATRPRTPRKPS